MPIATERTRWAGVDLRSGEGGFTLVFFAISIVALLGIAALVVDLGYWYLHADRIQRAADSAALAGVVYLPGNPNEATTVATSVAASNGFNGSEVMVATVPGQLHELRVTIKDSNVPAFFAKVFGLDKIAETRTSVARFQPPVPLGSAENSFGTGDLSLGVGSPTNIWAAVNGYCTSKENGDELLSKYDATYTGSTYDCPANPADPSTPHATTNYEYNPSGYIYDIQTPVQTQGTLSTDITVSAYDPSFNPGGCSNGETPDNSIGQSNTNITTSYSLYYAPTPLNPPSATNLLGTSTFVTNDSASCGKWVPIGTIPAGAANGTYQLEVSSQAGEANSEGTNGYGLEVNLGPFGAFQRCSTIPNPGWSNPNANNCPVIQGHNFLSVYANTAQSTGTFYLADVDSTYDGKTMNITLFDPGEGDHFIQILDPNGNPVHFTYQETDKCSSTPPLFPPPPNQNSTDCAGPSGIPFPQNTSDSGSSGPGTLSNGNTVPEVLDVSQQVSQPPGIASRSQFNDRHLQLTVTVPPGSDGWWQIKYYSTSSVSDRTTWSVSLQGSPIHLVP